MEISKKLKVATVGFVSGVTLLTVGSHTTFADTVTGTTDTPVVTAPVDTGTTPTTDTPVVDPTTPSTGTDTPVVDPTTPSTGTDTPVVDPTTPSTGTDTPVVDPTTPSTGTDTPVVDPTTPSTGTDTSTTPSTGTDTGTTPSTGGNTNNNSGNAGTDTGTTAPTAPVVVDDNTSVVGSQNGQIIVKDNTTGSTHLADPAEVNGKVNSDGSIEVKDKAGKKHTLPNTGAGMTLGSILGMIVGAFMLFIYSFEIAGVKYTTKDI